MPRNRIIDSFGNPIKAKDGYKEDLEVGNKIVFSWGGILSKGTIASIRPVNYTENKKTGRYFVSRYELTVIPQGSSTTATVKDSRSTLKIGD